MRLATRTGLAAFVAASITLLAVGALFRGYFATVLQERVDTQLEERAKTAPILAAVADRLAQSELRTTLEGARVVSGGETISLGLLPADPLPAEIVPGYGKKRRVQVVTELSRAFALCAASDEATEVRDDVSFFQALQAALNKQSSTNRKTPEQIDAAIRQLVSKANHSSR